MKISFIGHSSFLIETESGIKILTDPFDVKYYNGSLRYEPYSGDVDLVLITHSHKDHDWRGYSAQHIDTVGPHEFKDIKINGMPTYHDNEGGAKRGSNIIFRVELPEGLSFAHCGDLGHIPDKEQMELLNNVNVLMIPVGGTYTIDGKMAAKMVNDLEVPFIMPMHYKTEYTDFPIEPIDIFLSYTDMQCEKVNTFSLELPYERKRKIICFNGK